MPLIKFIFTEYILSVSQNLAESLKFHHDCAPGRAFGHDLNFRVLLRSLSLCRRSDGGSLQPHAMIYNFDKAIRHYDHLIHYFLPFHSPRGQHMAFKKLPTNNDLLMHSTKCVAANNILFMRNYSYASFQKKSGQTVSLSCQRLIQGRSR